MSHAIPRLIVSPGEPAGIGPDVLLAAAAHTYPAEIVAIGDVDLFQQRNAALGLSVQLEHADLSASPTESKSNTLKIVHKALPVVAKAGQLDPRNAKYVLDVLDDCVAACQNHTASAMVTGPIQKSVLNSVYHNFSGHTEYLAEKTHCEVPVMMLATEELRVALVTTHAPLKQIPELITRSRLQTILEILHKDLQTKFGLSKPKILVAGLNPHAGEEGHLGTEEIEVISPVIKALQAKGFNLVGPLPADTLFTDTYLRDADAVLAMYHDQGLPVLKYKGFGNAINITLGLPINRTSVDHGTALELAGTGKANPASMKLAIQTAIDMSRSNP